MLQITSLYCLVSLNREKVLSSSDMLWKKHSLRISDDCHMELRKQ